MKHRVSWLKKEDHDEYWNDPLHWNRTTVELNEDNPSKRKLEDKVSEKEGIVEGGVVVMQTTK